MKVAKLNSRLRTSGPKKKPALLKLDFGCGTRPREGFTGIDWLDFPNVIKCDLSADRWLFKKDAFPGLLFDHNGANDFRWYLPDNSVEAGHCSHFIEHLTAWERVAFVNELHRVLVPGGQCTLIAPNWSAARAYGDPTHQWPPISGFWFFYLNREWRLGGKAKCPKCNGNPGSNGAACEACGGKGEIEIPANAPHTDVKFNPRGFKCHFAVPWGESFHPEIANRSDEYKQFALQWYKEAGQDIVATLTAIK